ncbi:O-methyltransferase afvC [Lasiodiplodia theobromae]|uniref:O-methyltransferase afvC n=1 Tax=Lasiodiplodia theobromae TaxID=45133 RepID=A0A5N5D3H8_9PEZI|nr:O-methyltransferase afvC [Lasiodiplodia theobromae]
MSSPSSNQVDLENLAGDLTSAIRAFKDAPPSSTEAVLKRRLVTQLAKNIITEAEEPGERPFEYVAQMAELATLRILMEWRALEHIPSAGSITYAELATKISADASLIRRLCWPLVASELLAQPAADAIAHTAASRCFTNDNPQGAYFKIFYDTITPSAVAWPRWAASHGRTPPVEPSDNPFTWGHGAPAKSYWELASGAMQVDMNTSMQSLDTLLPVNGAYPFALIAERAGDVAPDAALVVDVGGGRGQAIERMREECPGIPAERCVLQDTAEVIADVGEGLEGVRRMVVDYFEEQPVKGALVYFLRRILHDWSDKYCVRILERLRDAMAEYSRILIMDQILDDPPNRIAGSPAYKAFMQRAYQFAYNSSSPPPPSHDDPTDDDIAALQPLLTHLKHAAERALGYQRICHVLLGGPRKYGVDAGGYYERTMLAALQAAGLTLAQDWLAIIEDMPPHFMTSAGSAAVGALRLDDYELENWDQYVLVVEATRQQQSGDQAEEEGGLGVVTAAVLDDCILRTREVGMEVMRGGGGGDEGEVVERLVRDVVGRLPEFERGPVDKVVVHGDGAGVSGVREALERVLGEAMVGEAFGEEGDDEAVFAAADGLARDAFVLLGQAPTQKAAPGCRFISGLYKDGWRELWKDVQLAYWG